MVGIVKTVLPVTVDVVVVVAEVKAMLCEKYPYWSKAMLSNRRKSVETAPRVS